MIIQAIILSVVVLILNFLAKTFVLVPYPYINLFIWALVIIFFLGYTINPITWKDRRF